ncbi:hypothetical protein [Streptomyces calidiresistens]|uniref:Uncharacterized protein n=1 Tax=Streptomyces calidiresistens TaxID=1485586 RepID=A0A7W3T292_9ACTN|nr:hypothetical protein [Streptomyces calidiresistens]MBB0229602.1 hypothetical protein [Streptomyces calidiresistens]
MKAYMQAFGKGSTREVVKARKSPALKAFEAPFTFLVDVEERTADYSAVKENPQSERPLTGGSFQNLYGEEGKGKFFAVMRENYRAKDTTYTASEAFINQWTSFRRCIEGPEGDRVTNMKKLLGSLLDHKGADQLAAEIPDELPARIYRQNISGGSARATLDPLLPREEQWVDFSKGDHRHQQITEETINGKSTAHIVATFNDAKKPVPSLHITGGRLLRDRDGNFHLRFDIGNAPAGAPLP